MGKIMSSLTNLSLWPRKEISISKMENICQFISVIHEPTSMLKEIGEKKYSKAEYVQRRVRFVNVQVPCPHSIIYVKFCTSRLCMKMSSFLFVLAYAMAHMLYLSCGIPFPV